MEGKITIKGAKEHNLKGIDLEIPRDRLVVITGVSGSGKSSLAFDTIYAEGQRRYVESLSTYARQFLGQLKRPDVDYIEGLSPAISIDQHIPSKNPRSTVGTMSEIYDYLRLLFARIGKPHCYSCGRPIIRHTTDTIIGEIDSLGLGKEIQILAPLVKGRKGLHQRIFQEVRRRGYIRVRVDGRVFDIEDLPPLERERTHTIEVVVDRVVLRGDMRRRLADSIEAAMGLGDGMVIISTDEGDLPFSRHLVCAYCDLRYEDLSTRLFSFNSPYGACPGCKGVGFRMEVDPDLVIPDREKSVVEGAIRPMGLPSLRIRQRLEALSFEVGIDLGLPFSRLPSRHQRFILYGYRKKFEGVVPLLERLYRRTESERVREWIEGYMRTTTCSECGGARLRRESLSVLVEKRSIYDISRLSIREAREFFGQLRLQGSKRLVAHSILEGIKKRLEFLENVGLHYLSLDRASSTLSAGEIQRIRLATQMGSGLVGVLYILDEPSIGLHPRDIERLLATFYELVRAGNTLIVVEHDPSIIKSADHIIDLGPGAGEAGGYVVATGPPKKISKEPTSLTGQYLSGRMRIPVPAKRKDPDGRYLVVKGASLHNLKRIDVRIPIGLFTCITGVSGSGKSTLVQETICVAVDAHLRHHPIRKELCEEIRGLEHIEKVIVVDQSPIGRTPRSNPATYTGLFAHIRTLYGSLQESRIRGYRASRFSFNRSPGRCEICQGDGAVRVEMHFLPDVYVECEACKGRRYNQETLEVRYQGKNIAEVLEMSVDEARRLFRNIPPVKRRLDIIAEVGLGYMKLGQPANTLSGGETQRIKLSSELIKRSTGRSLYILDEPTTGLHFADIQRLLDILYRLRDRGNTIVVIEHNLDVIKSADYIVDLGPEGGDDGGYIVAQGTPEEVAKEASSYTGQFLREVL
jgi:excinuclease ABC subunit A